MTKLECQIGSVKICAKITIFSDGMCIGRKLFPVLLNGCPTLGELEALLAKDFLYKPQ